MPARKGAARRRKFKKWALEVWSFAKGYLSFSKLLVYVKSEATKTRVYAIKRKLMRERLGIDVREV